jgi:hypothetical protein
MAFKKYFYYHPESDSLWGQPEPYNLDEGDGLVEEISYVEYLELERKLKGLKPMIQDFDARTVAPRQGGSAHPPGMFPFTITNTYLQENKEKTGAMLVVEMSSDVGSIENRYNVINPSPDAVRIANEQLSALCHAVNIYQVAFPKNADGSPIMDKAGFTLRGGKGRMEVVPQMDKNGQPNGYMKVNKVFDINGNEPGKTGSQPQPQQQNNQPMQQNNAGGWTQSNQQPAQQQPAQQGNAGWANPQQQPNQQQPQQQQPSGGGPAWAR